MVSLEQSVLRLSPCVLLRWKNLGNVCIVRMFILGWTSRQFSLSFSSFPVRVYFENCTWILYSRPEPLAVLGTQVGSPDLELHMQLVFPLKPWAWERASGSSLRMSMVLKGVWEGSCQLAEAPGLELTWLGQEKGLQKMDNVTPGVATVCF